MSHDLEPSTPDHLLVNFTDIVRLTRECDRMRAYRVHGEMLRQLHRKPTQDEFLAELYRRIRDVT